MLSQGKEIAAIDFSAIIGGPLEAVIIAQAKSANVTRQFIEDTAFEKSTNSGGQPGSMMDGAAKLKFVQFDYAQMMGTGTNNYGKDDLNIRVPLLTMLPIPFIRVDTMTIDFNVSLHSTKNVDKGDVDDGEADASAEYAGTKFKTSITDKNTYQNGTIIDDTYSLRVTVNAVQDQMPGGMQTVLNIFNNVIQQQSALIQQVMSQQITAQSKQLASLTNPTTGGQTPAS